MWWNVVLKQANGTSGSSGWIGREEESEARMGNKRKKDTEIAKSKGKGIIQKNEFKEKQC